MLFYLINYYLIYSTPYAAAMGTIYAHNAFVYDEFDSWWERLKERPSHP